MLFSVDAHAIGCHLTGNEVYVRNLLNGFAAVDRVSSFLAYVSVDGAERLVPKGFSVRKVSRNPFIRLGFDLPRKLRQDKPELLHVQYTAPIACPVPVLVSVHDVSYLEYPEFFSPARAWQLRRTVARTVRSAAKILTGSEFSRRAIARVYSIDPAEIVVIPNAADASFRPVARDVAASRVHSRFGIRSPFLLTVGDLAPRKNQVGLVRAFAELIRSHPELPYSLVLAGKAQWQGSRVMDAVRACGIVDRVIFPGFVTDEELLYLYNACDLFVFPSFYEGFGLPVLEAMACSRAVVCSNASALPEVADGAAIFFDPHSVDEMARSMRDVLLDSELRGRMERLGLQRATQFSWEKAASRTLDVYREVAERNSMKRPEPKPASVAHS